MDYKENRSRFIGKKKGSQFIDAVTKVDEYILNPTVCINESISGCWVMSNFKKHLERAHHLVIDNLRPKKIIAKSNSSDAAIVDEISSCSTEHKTDSNSNNIEQNEIKNITIDDEY